MAYSQKGQIGYVTTPLPENTLLLASMSGSEAISQLFHYQLELFSERDSIDFRALVGKPITVEFEREDGFKRYFNGIVSRFSQAGLEQRFTVYQAEVVPWLWLLTRKADCRIFQAKTVPDIIKEIFDDLGLTDYEFKLDAGTYEPWNYCVQYRETAFNFVSRLMEQEGIFYYFRHEKSKHVLILCDNSSSQCADCPGQSQVRYAGDQSDSGEEGEISAWLVEHALQPGKYAMTDYHFLDPSPSLLVNAQTGVEVGENGRFEIFDYPGEFVKLGREADAKRDKGERWVQVRMQCEDTPTVVIRGESHCRALTSGYHFELKDHYRRDRKFDKAYLITSVNHRLSQRDAYVAGGSGGGRYANSFACIAYSTPFRPARLTPKPVVQGPQTAVVVGGKEEEIDVDKYGRICVQFHWDRKGERNEKSSCRIRVSQSMAGKNWGAIFLPRVGQEVIVDFLEGDPDQPIVTGCVYNAQYMPPYELPANRTRSGIKTRSSSKGAPENFNEIRFEDKKGKEELYLHAERDLRAIVEVDARHTVGHDSRTFTKGILSHIVQGDAYDWFRSSHRTTVANEEFVEAPKIIVEAGETLSLKGPGGFIVIDASGVTIVGNMIKINSGGASAVSSIGSGPVADKAKEP